MLMQAELSDDQIKEKLIAIDNKADDGVDVTTDEAKFLAKVAFSPNPLNAEQRKFALRMIRRYLGE